MKTINGRIQDLVETGATSCDGYTPNECLKMVNEIGNVLGQKLIFDGVKNEIRIEGN